MDEVKLNDNTESIETGEKPSTIDPVITGSDAALTSTFNIPPSTLTLPKSSLGDIVEEGDPHTDDNIRQSPSRAEHPIVSSPVSERVSSAIPKSRKGTSSRNSRWNTDNHDGLPNTSSTMYSTIGPSRGLDGYDLPDQWSNSRGSQMLTSPLTSPTFTPSLGGSPEPNRKSRIQIKDHGPVAKWLAKRQKKKEEEPVVKPRSKSRGPKKYAPHIQPKVSTRNDEYEPTGGDVPPVRSEKLVWNAKPVVQTHNERYKPAAEEKSNSPNIMNEKLHWDSQTKVDMWNRDYKPAAPRKFTVFSEKLQWYEQPKVDTKNTGYQPAVQHNQPIPIMDEELHWSAKNKVDSYNKMYRPPKGNNFTVFHETPQWKAHSKLDNTRPHYMPSRNNMKVKTDKLNWSSQAKIDTFNPSYVHIKAGNDETRNDNVGKSHKESNGWSSHSSDSETEWFVSTPGSEQMLERKATQSKPRIYKADADYYQSGQPADRDIVWHPRKLIFNSKQLVENEQSMTSRSYPSYKSRANDKQFSQAQKVPPIKPYSSYKQSDPQPDKKKVKSKRVFKERTGPLPPVGTFTHRANQPVIYPENLTYNGYRAPRTQKIEVIDMKDLSLMSKKDRHTIFIN